MKPAIAAMSYVRTRVAISDWWASRNVVSVSSSRRWCIVQSAKPSAPSRSRICRVPGAGGVCADGGIGGTFIRAGAGLPFTSGLPLTVTSAR